MLKTHKIALDPNNVQATQFAQHCGYGRVAYNHALADFKAGLAKGDWHSHIDLQHRFNAVKYDKYPWAKDMSQTVSKCAIYNNLKDAIVRWQSGQNRFPKFKQSVPWSELPSRCRQRRNPSRRTAYKTTQNWLGPLM